MQSYNWPTRPYPIGAHGVCSSVQRCYIELGGLLNSQNFKYIIFLNIFLETLKPGTKVTEYSVTVLHTLILEGQKVQILALLF